MHGNGYDMCGMALCDCCDLVIERVYDFMIWRVLWLICDLKGFNDFLIEFDLFNGFLIDCELKSLIVLLLIFDLWIEEFNVFLSILICELKNLLVPYWFGIVNWGIFIKCFMILKELYNSVVERDLGISYWKSS